VATTAAVIRRWWDVLGHGWPLDDPQIERLPLSVLRRIADSRHGET
jgi:hypothetical protein